MKPLMAENIGRIFEYLSQEEEDEENGSMNILTFKKFMDDELGVDITYWEVFNLVQIIKNFE